MKKSVVIKDENIEYLPLSEFTEKAYLDYSMYVILDRALPFIGDGLKPVQRRIIYAMSELGLSAAAKYKKAARTVGDVLGKFHPHGDSACYEAMVLMAQPFSFRYPLVDGQGNWGSSDDPKSFAAMRYTEAKLTGFSKVLLDELGQGTVDWGLNFDGTLREPKFLPARLPTVLLNGATGIAVGMATDIPPHNVTEIVNASIHLLDNPKSKLNDLMQFVPAPDYPTDAEIISSKADLQKIYETGHGSIRMRAVYSKEQGDVIITALPHQVSGSKILEQIAAQIQAKKLPMVSDLRDESDHENPTRLVITPRSNRVDVEQLMGHLFATTDLERTYRVNMNVVGIDGRPQVKNLLSLLSEWLDFRKTTVKKRLEHRLEKVLARLHILDGLLIAFLNIDEVIEIIRTADEPKAELIKRFKLSETQAEAILEIKLRQLAKLEEIKIRAEQKELAKERDELEKILGSNQRLKTLIKKELKADLDTYGDPRRSPVMARDEAKAITEMELVPSEPVTVILSQKGWIRAAKGHDIEPEKLSYKSGDDFLSSAMGKSNQLAAFIDSTGRAYAIACHSLPSARSQGEPITGKVTPPAGAVFNAVVLGNDDQRFLFASDAGYGFIGRYADLLTKNRKGKALLSLPNGARVLHPAPVHDLESDNIIAISNEGRMLVFPVTELPELARGKGNKIIQIPSAKLKAREEYVASLIVLPKDKSLKIVSGKRYTTMKPKDIEHYIGERGRRGSKLPRGFQKVDKIEIVE